MQWRWTQKQLGEGDSLLLFILFYLKGYPTFELLGVFIEMDRSECHRQVKNSYLCLKKSCATN